MHIDQTLLAGARTSERSAGDLLESHAGRLCELEDGRALAVETARRLACDATLVGIVDGANGEPLNVGRRTRAISPLLYAARFVPGTADADFPDAAARDSRRDITSCIGPTAERRASATCSRYAPFTTRFSMKAAIRFDGSTTVRSRSSRRTGRGCRRPGGLIRARPRY